MSGHPLPEMSQIEFEMLTAVNAKDNPESYNWHNGHPGKQKLRIDLVRNFVQEVNTLRNHNELEKSDFGLSNQCVVLSTKASVLAKER